MAKTEHAIAYLKVIELKYKKYFISNKTTILDYVSVVGKKIVIVNIIKFELPNKIKF